MAAATTIADADTERTYRRKILAWSFYDWADHAFITSTSSTFFPTYFIAIAAPAFLEAGKAASDLAAQALARDNASNIYAISVSIALFLSALVAPIIGTYADITGKRKRLLIITTVIGGVIASLMFTLVTGMWLLGLLLFMGAQVALNVALGLNSSLLPHITRPDDLDRASSLGYAMGYFGGGILLAANTALYLFADKLGIEPGTAVRIAFLLVGLWWIAFTLPLALNVPEPPATASPWQHGQTCY
jgi:UMF1 family MFS transporter